MVSRMNFRSRMTLSGRYLLALREISTFCPKLLHTTENITKQKAITDMPVGVATKFIRLKNRYTTGTNMANCVSLAVISAMLSFSIFQKICNGNCWIPANMKLAEKKSPNGNHQR